MVIVAEARAVSSSVIELPLPLPTLIIAEAAAVWSQVIELLLPLEPITTMMAATRAVAIVLFPPATAIVRPCLRMMGNDVDEPILKTLLPLSRSALIP